MKMKFIIISFTSILSVIICLWSSVMLEKTIIGLWSFPLLLIPTGLIMYLYGNYLPNEKEVRQK